MLKNLTESQYALAQLMSQLSEAGFSAVWMERLEFDLWDAVNGGSKQYGRHNITEDEIYQLKALSDTCGCWIIFDDEKEETAVTLENWKRIAK